jgi:hypothetical protein
VYNPAQPSASPLFKAEAPTRIPRLSPNSSDLFISCHTPMELTTLAKSPQLFHLQRHEDQHGHSGCGIVAEGVIFANGKCVIQWLHKIASVATFDSIEDLVAIHGHGGTTVVILTLAPSL